MKHLHPTTLKRMFLERTSTKAFKELQQRQADELRRKNAEKAKNENDDTSDDILIVVAMASQENVQAFRDQLNEMQQRTIERVLYLQHQRDALLAEQQQMLENAYALEDGRRVFRSEDSTYVIDENGSEVRRDVVDPDDIGDGFTSAETYLSITRRLDDNEHATSEAIQFQEQLDDLGDRLGRDELTQEELDVFIQELEYITPESFQPDMDIDPSQPQSSPHMTTPDPETDIGPGLR